MTTSAEIFQSRPHAQQKAVTGLQLAFDRLSLGLIIAGAFCCPINWAIDFVEPLPVTDIFFLVAMLIQAPWALQGVVRLGGVPLLPVCGGLLFALSGMILLALAEPNAQPVAAAKLVFSLTLLPLLLVLVVRDDFRRLDAILAAWLAGAALTGSVALLSRYNIPVFGFLDTVGAAGGRAFGLSYHPNELGYTGALTAPVAVYLFLRFRNGGLRVLTLMALVAVLAGIHLSGSRSSLWALVLGAMVPAVGLLQLRRAPSYLTLVLALLAGAALALAVASEFDLIDRTRIQESAIGRVLGLSSSAAGSDAGRVEFAKYGWNEFLKNPYFGNGYGWLRVAHVHVIAVLQSGGLLGITAFLTWLAGILIACWRVAIGIRLVSPEAHRLLLPTAVAGLVVWFANGALQPILTDRNGYILVGALLALDGHVRRAAMLERLRMRESNGGGWA
jgi:O-antigen ligase